MPSGFVEEPLQHERLLGGKRAQNVLRLAQIVLDLASGGGREPKPLEPLRGSILVVAVQAHFHVGPQPGHRARQLRAPSGRLSQPEGDGRRLPVGVRHPHGPRIDREDAPRRVAQLEDVAGGALDGEILVEGSDEGLLGIQHHPVVGVVGDGAARGDGGEAGRPTAPDAPVDPVAVNQGSAPPAPGDEALGHHLDDLVEVLARQFAIRVRPAPEAEELLLGPGLARRLGHGLLRQHVERLRQHHEPVQLPIVHGPHQRRALHQVVAREGEEPALGGAAHGVPGAPDPLQERRDPARRADLAHQVHMPDVDAELERRRRHQRLQASRAQPVLGVQARLLGEAAVVRGNRLFAKAVGEPGRQAFRHPARVDEDEGGLVGFDRLGQPLVDLRPDLVRHHRFHGRRRHLDRQVHGAPVPLVDDGAALRINLASRLWRAEARDLDRVLGRSPMRCSGAPSRCPSPPG